MTTRRAAGPLLDRIDIHLAVPGVQHEDLAHERRGELCTTAALAQTMTVAMREPQPEAVCTQGECVFRVGPCEPAG